MDLSLNLQPRQVNIKLTVRMLATGTQATSTT